MLQKDHEVKWNVSSRYAFEQIKKAIFKAPTLASPDYTNHSVYFHFPLKQPFPLSFTKE